MSNRAFKRQNFIIPEYLFQTLSSKMQKLLTVTNKRTPDQHSARTHTEKKQFHRQEAQDMHSLCISFHIPEIRKEVNGAHVNRDFKHDVETENFNHCVGKFIACLDFQCFCRFKVLLNKIYPKPGFPFYIFLYKVDPKLTR